MFAKDIMTPNVVTVGPDAPVSDIAKLLIARRISAVPVIAGNGEMLGIVSEGDLVHRVDGDFAPPRPWWLKLLGDFKDTPTAYAKAHGSKAGDVMTRPVITVTEFTSLAEIAMILEKHRIERVPVIRDGKLAGIVSRADVIQALITRDAGGGPKIAASDRMIRENLLSELGGHAWADTVTLNVTVDDGVVCFFGHVESEDARRAMHIAAENIAGVKAVEDHLGIGKPIAYAGL